WIPLEVFVIPSIPRFGTRNLDQPGSFATPSNSPSSGAPALGRVPLHYQRFFTTTSPAATLWPDCLPAVRSGGFLPRGQEGFSSSACIPSLRAAASTPPEPPA